jgi:predicted DNA binding protein
MRYLTALVEPNGGEAFHPLGKELTDDPSITRKAIHHIELLDDGTVLLFAEASGSKEQYEQIMRESSYVIDHLTGGDDRWMAVSQFEPTEEVRQFLKLQRKSHLVIDMPIRFTSDSSVKITYLGSDKMFARLYEYAKGMDESTFEILKTGDYEGNRPKFSRMITARQEEVLEVAVEEGYYSEPRKASLEDISEVVGISPGTVGEHLRKTEERVFNELVH